MIVDVIILSLTTSDQIAVMTQKAIDTLHASETDFTFNVLLLESNKDSRWTYQNCITIVPDIPFHYNRFLNYGIDRTKNEYIVSCNNDLVFHKGWFSEIYKHKDVADSFSPWNNHGGWHKKLFETFDNEYQEGYRTSYEITGWCFVTKRKVFDSFRLDEQVDFFYSDNLYADDLVIYNHKHILVRKSLVDHMTSVTYKGLSAQKQTDMVNGLEKVYLDIKEKNKNKKKMIRVLHISANTNSYHVDHSNDNVVQQGDGFTYEFKYLDDVSFPPRINSLHPRLQSKIPKMLGHELFPGYDYYLWTDSNITLKSPDAIKHFLDLDSDWVLFNHNRRTLLKEEFEFMIEYKNRDYLEKYINEFIPEQYIEYKTSSDNFDSIPLYGNGCLMYKNTELNKKITREWYYHNARYSIQCQLSLPYVLNKYPELKISTIYNIIDNKYTKYWGYEKEVVHKPIIVIPEKVYDSPKEAVTDNMKIDLGCGRRKKAGYFGIDCQELDGVDMVCDCNEVIPLDDNIASEINAVDFLEHVNNDKRIHIMTEVWRLLKPGGLFTSITPSTDGRGAFQDPTHLAFWNENSFWYFTRDDYRALYNIKPKFEIVSLETTPLDAFNICFVKATLKAIK